MYWPTCVQSTPFVLVNAVGICLPGHAQPDRVGGFGNLSAGDDPGDLLIKVDRVTKGPGPVELDVIVIVLVDQDGGVLKILAWVKDHLGGDLKVAAWRIGDQDVLLIVARGYDAAFLRGDPQKVRIVVQAPVRDILADPGPEGVQGISAKIIAPEVVVDCGA